MQFQEQGQAEKGEILDQWTSLAALWSVRIIYLFTSADLEATFILSYSSPNLWSKTEGLCVLANIARHISAQRLTCTEPSLVAVLVSIRQLPHLPPEAHEWDRGLPVLWKSIWGSVSAAVLQIGHRWPPRDNHTTAQTSAESNMCWEGWPRSACAARSGGTPGALLPEGFLRRGRKMKQVSTFEKSLSFDDKQIKTELHVQRAFWISLLYAERSTTAKSSLLVSMVFFLLACLCPLCWTG